MQPLINPEVPQPVPVTPLAQLIFRFRQRNPAFFNWLAARSFYFSLIAGSLPFIVKTLLPILEIEPPDWLTYSNRVVLGLSTLFAGAGLGSVFASQTALNTAGTPPVIIKPEEAKAEDINKLVAEAVAAELAKRDVPKSSL